MKQSEIDRAIVLFYRSNNSQDFINYVRPAGWLDNLPAEGLSELVTLLESARNDVLREMDARPAPELDARGRALIDAAWKRHCDPRQNAADYAKVCAETNFASPQREGDRPAKTEGGEE